MQAGADRKSLFGALSLFLRSVKKGAHGGPIDFVIHNMGLKIMHAPALNQWWWEGGMICGLILTNEIAVQHTEVLPNFFSC